MAIITSMWRFVRKILFHKMNAEFLLNQGSCLRSSGQLVIPPEVGQFGHMQIYVQQKVMGSFCRLADLIGQF